MIARNTLNLLVAVCLALSACRTEHRHTDEPRGSGLVEAADPSMPSADESDEERMARIFRTTTSTGVSGRIQMWRVRPCDVAWLREHHPEIVIRSVREE